MTAGRTAAILTVLALLLATGHAEWMPGDWQLSGGTRHTSAFEIANPTGPALFRLDSSLVFSEGGEPVVPEPDFIVSAVQKGFQFDAGYRIGANTTRIHGRVEQYQGDGVYLGLYATASESVTGLWLTFFLRDDDRMDKITSVDGSIGLSPASLGDKTLSARQVIFAEGYPGQFVLQSAARLPHKMTRITSGGKPFIKVSVDITGGQKVAAGQPVFYTARFSERDFAPRPYCSPICPLTNGEITRYGVYEAAFQTLGVPMTDPYDVENIPLLAGIALPDGEISTIRPFYSHPYAESGEGADAVVQPSARPYFMVRFSPREAGDYSWKLYAGEGDKAYSSPALDFKCTDGDDGFVIVAPDDHRYLMLSSGKPWYPVGLNLGWTAPSLPSRYAADLREMAKHGINATRVWQSTWGIRIDDASAPFGFNGTGLHTMDEFFRTAADLKMKAMLVLTNAEDINKNRSQLPYFSSASEASELFAESKVRESFLKRIPYLVTRYGPYNSLWAFEPGNELDYCTDLKTYASWTAEVASAIRNHDINRHLVTASLGFNAFDVDFWRTSTADLVQYHGYMRSPAFHDKEVESSAARMVASFAKHRREIALPAMLTEFGYTESSDTDSLSKADAQGIALQNSLWSSLFAGMSGTALNWWWDGYVIPNGLLTSYRPVARFVEGVDFTREKFAFSSQQLGEINLSLMTGKTMVMGYLDSYDNNWVDLVAAQKQPKEQKGITITLRDLPRGYVRVEWWDTVRGVKVSDFRSQVNGEFQLKAPDFRRSIALRILYERME